MEVKLRGYFGISRCLLWAAEAYVPTPFSFQNDIRLHDYLKLGVAQAFCLLLLRWRNRITSVIHKMATIHPSRLGMVPHEPTSSTHDRDSMRDRSPPRRRSRSRDNGYSQDYRREQDKESGRNGGEYRRSDRRHERARADDYFDEERDAMRGRKRSRSRSVDKERNMERDDKRERDSGRARRPSPEYSEYRRPSSRDRENTTNGTAPWRQQENVYPPRGERRALPPTADWLESRRQQRENSTFSIWPPSPKAPTRTSPSPERKHRKKSKKHRRHSSSESDTDSEDERRRRRKERKKSRKEKDRDRDRSRERHRHKSRSKSVRAYSDSEDERRDRHRSRHRSRSRSDSEERHRSRHRSHSHRSKTRTKSPEQRPPSSEEVDDDDWVEKPTNTILAGTSSNTNGATATGPSTSSTAPSTSKAAPSAQPEDGDSDDEVGPKPPPKANTSKRIDERQYGGALLRGEGSAMAAFLQDGTDVRIPRRGEIGLSSDEIASFESVGYVMSGSRHRRMNAVRMRKENQVISAEEKRGILKLQKEERQRREAILREEFQQLVEDRLKASGSKPT
ncbi:DUF926-domain-containing protein [Panus rudis PR-1116 ss-1]|nr:DUF926-domain-containing protein [Panus rudis PR-1116 ss-1]